MIRRRQTLVPAVAVLAIAVLAFLAAACGPASTQEPPTVHPEPAAPAQPAQAAKEEPPPSGEARDISFPPIVRAEAASGLELNTVEWHRLPIVYLRLVIRSGGEADPAAMPGLSSLVAAMLEEGTRKRSSAELAEEVEFLGADIWTDSDEENIYIGMRALSEHLEQALDLLADVAMSPSFRPDELRKLKKRELDRLKLQEADPQFLGRRELYRHLYGEHPYAHIDTTAEVLNKVNRAHLARWHRRWFVPNNAFLVVVGDATADRVKEIADQKFAKWRPGNVPETEYPEPPSRETRSVLLVDRPESEQSVIMIGHLSVARSNADWIPLRVANQVLGGSAASRLFMDLREQRSLTYGAYSGVGERVEVAPFVAHASVRNPVTGEAVSAFFEHLDRIVSDAAPEEEIVDAQRYLSDSFPLKIDTPGKIAGLVADLRVFGLPDTYWDTYRTRIREVGPDAALAAAQAHIHPSKALVVVVGRAAEVLTPLRHWGPVTVVDTKGKVVQRHEALPAEAKSDSGSESGSGSDSGSGSGSGS